MVDLERTPTPASMVTWRGSDATAGDVTMVYDQSQLDRVELEWARRAHWDALGQVRQRLGGRGGSVLIELGDHARVDCAVLRRYQRGGWVARISRDRYVYNGLERTRALREFRLLDRLHQAGLGVPRPLLASVERFSVWGYRQALMTQWIDGAQTLAHRLAQGQSLDWAGFARALAALVDARVYHPDLNAHNVLCDEAERWWFIDFDRARVGTRPRAGQRMVARLCASLAKHRLDVPLSRGELMAKIDRYRG